MIEKILNLNSNEIFIKNCISIIVAFPKVDFLNEIIDNL